MPQVEVIGVYPVKAHETCFLVELVVRGIKEPVDMGKVTQPILGHSESSWQVPWDEHFLDLSGDSPLDPDFPDKVPATSAIRVAFFFHQLDVFRPLASPWGNIPLPEVSPRPYRLAFMTYEKPGSSPESE